MTQSPPIAIIIAVIVVLAVVALRARRLMQERPLDLKRLWILPAALSLVAVYVMTLVPPSPTFLTALAVALAAGGGLGWLRAKTMTLRRTPEGVLMAKGSALAVVFLLVLLGARYALRFAIGAGALPSPLRGPPLDAVFVAFAAALFVSRCAELTLRGRSLS